MMASSCCRKVPQGHAVALQNLVGRAADAAQLDALGALGLGVFDHFRLLGHGHDHLGQNRLVAVDDDVDMSSFMTPRLASDCRG
jgi:hypothetical protein